MPITSTPDLDTLVDTSAVAFTTTVVSTTADRARWLRAVADTLDANSGELVALADDESALGTSRLTGELLRTTAQLRLFAGAIEEGSYLEATIDHANSDAVPPHPDLRRMLRPLGPVAVFSASNFPFAFSVAGGDTASALASGCPVIVKAHSAHPLLSRRTAALAAEALDSAGAPRGILSLVEGREAGVALVKHPAVRAVGFTGSLHGGRTLFDLAASRPDPIPFYGELSAVNPVLITAAALQTRGEELVAGLANSFTIGVGQFCTNPGVTLVPANSDFAEHLAAAVDTIEERRMLTPGIAAAYAEGVRHLTSRPDVRVVVGGHPSAAGTGSVSVFATTAAAVLADPGSLLAECFGPATLVVEYSSFEEALNVVRAVGGSLTATLHAEPSDDPVAVADAIDVLTSIAGRVLFDGWPTGVAVTWSQEHGGPWPSTTSIHTSVGVTALRRWLRPVAYQSAPDAVLPPALQESNPLRIPRRIDGVLKLPV
jgi:NADP-dependent aldehyde dehydrogenase